MNWVVVVATFVGRRYYSADGDLIFEASSARRWGGRGEAVRAAREVRDRGFVADVVYLPPR